MNLSRIIPLPVLLSMFGILHAEKTTYLGLAASHAPDERAEELKLGNGIGIVVDWVDPASPAADSLQVGDLIHRFNDQVLTSPQQLAILVQNSKVGETIKLQLIRDTASKTIELALMEREKPDAKPPAFPRLDVPKPRLRPLNESDIFSEFDRMFEDKDFGFSIEELRKEMSQAFKMTDQLVDGRFSLSSSNQVSKSRNQLSINGVTAQTVTENGKKTLTIKDEDGVLRFTGPLNTDDDRAKVPDEYTDLLTSLEDGHLFGGSVFMHNPFPQIQQRMLNKEQRLNVKEVESGDSVTDSSNPSSRKAQGGDEATDATDGIAASMTIVDGDLSINITGKPGEKKLHVTDKKKTIYDGPINTAEDRKNVPERIRNILKDLPPFDQDLP